MKRRADAEHPLTFVVEFGSHTSRFGLSTSQPLEIRSVYAFRPTAPTHERAHTEGTTQEHVVTAEHLMPINDDLAALRKRDNIKQQSLFSGVRSMCYALYAPTRAMLLRALCGS